MIEFNFDTEKGREETKQVIKEIIETDNKIEITNLLFAMLEFIVEHEVKLQNIKKFL